MSDTSKNPLASLSVVVMAFNEEECVAATIQDLISWLEKYSDDWEVILVDDGSTDGTVASLQNVLKKEERLKLMRHCQNLGMGAAIRTGYSAASKHWVTQLPADGQVPPSVLELLANNAGDADMVLSVYDKRGDGPLRTLLSRLFALTGRLILGQKSDFTGTMMIKRDILHNLPMISNSFLLNLEIPLRLLERGHTHGLLVFRPSPRLAGKSKVLGVGRILKVLLEMLKLRISWNHTPGKHGHG